MRYDEYRPKASAPPVEQRLSRAEVDTKNVSHGHDSIGKDVDPSESTEKSGSLAAVDSLTEAHAHHADPKSKRGDVSKIEKSPGRRRSSAGQSQRRRPKKSPGLQRALEKMSRRERSHKPSKVRVRRAMSSSRTARVGRQRRVRITKHKSRKPKSRPVSSTSTARASSVVSSVWNRQTAVMSRPFREPATGEIKGQQEPTLDPNVHAWVDSVLSHLDLEQTTFAMEALPQRSTRGPRWMYMQISLWLLQYAPDRMVDFLRATHHAPYPPINWIEDSLCHLARQLTLMAFPEQPIFKERLLNLFELLAQRESGEQLRFVNGFVRNMLPYCTAEEVVELYRIVKRCGVHIRGFTLLHIASRCARDSNFEYASDALLSAKGAGISVNRINYRSVCSTVLRSCMSQPEGLRVCLRLVSQLVDIGVKLNEPICDIIMLNAVDAGDVNTAFAVYRSLMERGLEPRESTFAVLLKGCKLNIDDADMLNSVIRDAISKINVRQSPLVATEILHCLALHHTKHNPDTALVTITEAYAQLFDTQPLQQLGLPLPPIRQQRATNEEAMRPSPHALGFMISASIVSIQNYSQRPDDIATLYARWRELVNAGHPILSSLATTDHVANVFLMAFIRTPSGLIHASRVVRDMQRPLAQPPATVTQCPPTVQTWSIFLHGFTSHGKLQLADQVLTYMRSKGIEPNEVTWNTLIMGHARAQDTERVFAALREAEAEGYLWNSWTETGVGWLRDRGRVGRERERRQLGQEFSSGAVDFTEDLKVGLSGRLSVAGSAPDEGVARGGDEGTSEYRYVPSVA